MQWCALVVTTVLNEDGDSAIERHVYDYNQVDRGFHLIREHFNKMVSRCHLCLQKVRLQNDMKLLERHAYDAVQ
jgi:hypothetical protein